jgi:hypothetical protein
MRGNAEEDSIARTVAGIKWRALAGNSGRGGSRLRAIS